MSLRAHGEASVSLTLDAIAGRYMLDVGNHHAGAEQTRIQVAWLIQFFGPTKLITEITHEDAQSLIRWRRTHTVGKTNPRLISAYAVSDTTEQLKELFTYLRLALAAANADRKPFPLEPKWKKLWLDEPKKKPRELVGTEEQRLVAAIFKVRPDLWPLTEFARTVGKRKTNSYTLQWDQVDWAAGAIKMMGKGGAPVASRSPSRSPRASAPSFSRSRASTPLASSRWWLSARSTRSSREGATDFIKGERYP